jgi:hypothetical protein
VHSACVIGVEGVFQSCPRYCWWFFLELKGAEAVVVTVNLASIRICSHPQYHSVVSTWRHRIMMMLQFWRECGMAKTYVLGGGYPCNRR